MHVLAPHQSISLEVPKQRLGKAVSVMAWIEDLNRHVLLVRQKKHSRLWTLPGGKVRLRETIQSALERELVEEIGLKVKSAHIVDIFDRPEKRALCILFRVILKKGQLRLGKKEIEAAMSTVKLPQNATPSLTYFWSRHFQRGKPICSATGAHYYRQHEYASLPCTLTLSQC